MPTSAVKTGVTMLRVRVIRRVLDVCRDATVAAGPSVALGHLRLAALGRHSAAIAREMLGVGAERPHVLAVHVAVRPTRAVVRGVRDVRTHVAIGAEDHVWTVSPA